MSFIPKKYCTHGNDDGGENRSNKSRCPKPHKKEEDDYGLDEFRPKTKKCKDRRPRPTEDEYIERDEKHSKSKKKEEYHKPTYNNNEQIGKPQNNEEMSRREKLVRCFRECCKEYKALGNNMNIDDGDGRTGTQTQRNENGKQYETNTHRPSDAGSKDCDDKACRSRSREYQPEQYGPMDDRDDSVESINNKHNPRKGNKSYENDYGQYRGNMNSNENIGHKNSGSKDNKCTDYRSRNDKSKYYESSNYRDRKNSSDKKKSSIDKRYCGKNYGQGRDSINRNKRYEYKDTNPEEDKYKEYGQGRDSMNSNKRYEYKDTNPEEDKYKEYKSRNDKSKHFESKDYGNNIDSNDKQKPNKDNRISGNNYGPCISIDEEIKNSKPYRNEDREDNDYGGDYTSKYGNRYRTNDKKSNKYDSTKDYGYDSNNIGNAMSSRPSKESYGSCDSWDKRGNTRNEKNDKKSNNYNSNKDNRNGYDSKNDRTGMSYGPPKESYESCDSWSKRGNTRNDGFHELIEENDDNTPRPGDRNRTGKYDDRQKHTKESECIEGDESGSDQDEYQNNADDEYERIRSSKYNAKPEPHMKSTSEGRGAKNP